VQTITSSVDFVTGSTRFGSLAANTHVFTGSILTSGSIGIGVTPFNNTLGPAFDMRNGVGLFGFGDATYLSGNMYFDSAWKVKNAGTGSQITLAGEIVFNTSTIGTTGSTVTNIERMRITNSGSVGINETNPKATLDIAVVNPNVSGSLRMQKGIIYFQTTQQGVDGLVGRLAADYLVGETKDLASNGAYIDFRRTNLDYGNNIDIVFGTNPGGN
jgi:hypothetical protein